MAPLPLHIYCAISYGCQTGWLIDGVFRVLYEKSIAPVIGRFDRIDENIESGEKLAIFVQPNGDEYRFDLEDWKKEEYPNEKCYHVIFCTENYWGFFSTGLIRQDTLHERWPGLYIRAFCVEGAFLSIFEKLVFYASRGG